jgi:hypothetical protein
MPGIRVREPHCAVACKSSSTSVRADGAPAAHRRRIDGTHTHARAYHIDQQKTQNSEQTPGWKLREPCLTCEEWPLIESIQGDQRARGIGARPTNMLEVQACDPRCDRWIPGIHTYHQTDGNTSKSCLIRKLDATPSGSVETIPPHRWWSPTGDEKVRDAPVSYV